MKTLGRYLKYNLKSTLLSTIIFSFFAVVCIATILPEYNEPYWYDNKFVTGNCSAALEILSVTLGILCIAIPMLQISPFKNKRNLDTLFAMPIERSKLSIATFISGYIQIAFIYTVAFVFHSIYLLLNTSWFNLAPLPLFYLSSLLAGLVVYSIFSFLIVKANEPGDGLWFALLWIGTVFVVLVALYVACDEIVVGTYEDMYGNTKDLYLRQTVFYDIVSDIGMIWSTPYSIISSLTYVFENHIEINRYQYVSETALEIYSSAYMFVLWAIIGIAAAYGYHRTFTGYRAYQAGELSTTWWGYKLLIPIYGYSLLSIVPYDAPVVVVVIYIAMLIGYFFYRRSFKLKKWDLICLAIGIIPMLITPEYIASIFSVR